MIGSIMSLILLVGAMLLAGLLAGFSYVLLLTQLGIVTHSQQPIRRSLFLLGGIASGLVLLMILFLIFQPETSPLVSVSSIIHHYRRAEHFDRLVGLLLVTGGAWLLIRNRRAAREPGTLKPSSLARWSRKLTSAKAGETALFSFGFLRAITRISGVAGLLVGVRLVSKAAVGPLLQTVLLVVLLAAALAPYAALLAVKEWYPQALKQVKRLSDKVKRLPLQRYTGIGLVSLGVIFIGLSLFAL